MNITAFIQKLRDLPQRERIIIFMAVMTLATVVAGYLAIKSTVHNISNFGDSLQTLKISTASISNVTTAGEQRETDAELAVDPTASWQIYAAADHGFSIKYPKEFLMSTKKSANSAVVLWESFSANQTVTPHSSLDVEVFKSALAPKEWIAENFKEGAFAVDSQSIKETLLPAGPAWQFNIATPTFIYHYTVVSTQGKVILLAGHEAMADPYTSPLYDHFVNSFTLIK